jgi:hypothetical protein
VTITSSTSPGPAGRWDPPRTGRCTAAEPASDARL